MTEPPPSLPFSPAGRLESRRWAVLLAILGASLLFQYLLFRGFAEREIAPEPPRYHDQSGYLEETYRAYERIRHEGLVHAVARDLQLRRPNGLLIPLEGAVLLLVTGPSRVGALTLNFLFFALFQMALAATLLWWSRRLSFALFGVGLLLLVRSPFLWAGGLTDFRFDFAAFCCWGVFLALVLRSGFFRSPAWSFAAGVAAAFLILQRFLTVTYVGGTLGLFLTALVLGLRGRSPQRALLHSRLRGLLVALVPIALLVGPAVWYCRDSLWQYYVVGHFRSGEGLLRARASEIVRLGQVLAYYPRTILTTHPGPFWGVVALLALAVSLRPFRPSLAATAKDESLRTGLLFFITAFAVPFAILTADPDKSPVVGSILVPPATLGLLWIVGIRSGLLGPTTPPSVTRSWRIVGPVVFGLGLLYQAYALDLFLWKEAPRRPEVVRLHEEAYQAVRRASRARPVVFSDRVRDDSFDHRTLAVTAYERHGVLLDTANALGTGIRAVSPAVALEALRRSDLALVTDSEGHTGGYPHDISMREASAALRALCASSFLPAGRFLLPERAATLWVRRPEAPRDAPVEGEKRPSRR